MNNQHNMEQLITLKGNLIYLKRIDMGMAEDMSESMMNISYETKTLTTTRAIFSKGSISRFIEGIEGDSSRVDFAIYSAESGKLVGDLALTDIDRANMCCNIRVALDDRNNFGRGYGQEAMKLAMNYGFGMLNLNRIELEVLAVNKRARHVYSKLGFVKEGVRRQSCYFNYRYHDMVSMACLREDFIKIHVDCMNDELLCE